MVQSLNTPAIWTLITSVIRRPGLLVPHVSVNSISDIDYKALRYQVGITAIIYDKDHTLTQPYSNTLHASASSGLQSCVSIFGHDRVAILSNSAGTKSDDPGYIMAQTVENSLGINVIRHSEKKPGGLEDVLRHFNTKDPTTICIIGDRLLTDIVFGNLYGMLTIHTMPLVASSSSSDDDKSNNDSSTTTTTKIKKDNWTARMLRPMENRILYGNHWWGRALQRRTLVHRHWSGPKQCSLVLPPPGQQP